MKEFTGLRALRVHKKEAKKQHKTCRRDSLGKL